MVELASAAFAYFLFTLYGASLQTLFTILFTFLLIPLVFIDIRHKLLPDNITYLLLWSGIVYSLTGAGLDINNSILGVIVGYMSLWSVYIIFKLLTGKEGMGHGDFKLLAAIGAWVGWQQLLSVILISSLAGTLVGIALLIKAKHEQREMTSIPFGPYLAAGGWITLIWGQDLSRWYLSTI
jgi:leader peptidase (prepilin peptidase)/N-methyltransferase